MDRKIIKTQPQELFIDSVNFRRKLNVMKPGKKKLPVGCIYSEMQGQKAYTTKKGEHFVVGLKDYRTSGVACLDTVDDLQKR